MVLSQVHCYLLTLEKKNSSEEQKLKDDLKSMSVKDSAEAVAIAFNVPRRDIYQLALQIKSGGD